VNKRSLGSHGENQAVSYLKNLDYVILERNYRVGRNEVDIICEKEGFVVFVEVKKRSGNQFGNPIEAVDREKTRKIIRVAQRYLYRRGLLGECRSRFDVIGILGNRIEHVQDAFREQQLSEKE
jgi:putative endonuclease